MPSVLFVCTANRYRSPLAAALFRKALGEKGIPGSWKVASAGTWAAPGLPVLSGVAEVARTYDLDLSPHRSARLDRPTLAANDLVLVMENSHQEALQSEFPAYHERVHLFSQVVEGRPYDIPDWMGNPQEIERTAADLDELIRLGLDSICSLAVSLQEGKE
jgi:protein-tyrosine-phosphatase